MPLLSEYEENTLAELFQKKHGFPLGHSNISNNKWTVATWKELEVPYLRPENPSLINELDSLWHEIANTDRKTTILPEQASIKFGVDHEYILDYNQRLDNILTSVGMTDMAKNRTAESSNGTSHIAVGDNATAEALGNTALGNELDRKAWSEKITVNQTERYAGSFVRSDFGSDVTLTEAGGFTDSGGGSNILVFRVTFTGKPIASGQIMTAQVAVTHVNGTVI
ncbi:tail-collar fiber protein [Nitrososphaeria virus YSH_1032793]|uniref:Tail-collar fiber protein n=1 Tax=Nitrososphaeria virus YSH_1032793 TaxID=3071320 RepID=A0A976YDR9_9CAUD|nr:tail-collar fiber protein [Yangshan Harbor Nitrososphaeria virus]UVF62228.1 tail-collar fiber protein [Nitrososphaeria virus YSH_1032793]